MPEERGSAASPSSSSPCLNLGEKTAPRLREQFVPALVPQEVARVGFAGPPVAGAQ